MKRIEWEGREWYWNPIDKGLLHVNDWTYDFKEALPFLNNTRKGIQAGGAMGLWPYLMSKHFQFVYTYEASKDNFFHMLNNLNNVENIRMSNLALGDKESFCDVLLHERESQNAGCYYTVDSAAGSIRQVKLDDEFKGFDDIDFIALDIEGNEKKALEGGINLIKRCKPVIMLENKKLPHSDQIGHKVNDAIDFLLPLGYKIVKTVHRDVILKHV